MDIVLEGLTKSYDGKTVLENFSAVFREGRTTCVMGPSGEGKTTLLRILMGLEKPDGGRLSGLSGRRVSAVFQEDRLCEGLSAVTNIKMACSRRATGQASREEILEQLREVGLSESADRKVRELSGGMSRRVSVVRAMMADYDVLFLDEPFKGLDEGTKRMVMDYVKRRGRGRTIIMVSHDVREAEEMGADVVTLE